MEARSSFHTGDKKQRNLLRKGGGVGGGGGVWGAVSLLPTEAADKLGGLGPHPANLTNTHMGTVGSLSCIQIRLKKKIEKEQFTCKNEGRPERERVE